MGFSDDIGNFGKKNERKIKMFNIEFVQDLARALVTATPVKTGFLRNSWCLGINSRPGPEFAGKGALQSQFALLMSSTASDVFNISNVANYAYFVEFGTARMSPRAFVRNTLVTAPSIAEAVARRIQNV